MRCRTTTICVGLLLAGCTTARPTAQALPAGPQAPVEVASVVLGNGQPCTGTFVAHPLDHITTVRGDVHLFDSNGAGAAIGDLDGDNRQDIVLANLDGTNTILWNEGNLRFHAQSLDFGNSRATNIVDVDGDDRLDIVFTQRGSGVSVWHNEGGRAFGRTTLPGVLHKAYAMAWGDLNGDNRLDLVTGGYDSELSKQQTNNFLLSGGVGVYAYEQGGDGRFSARRLATTSQALAVALPDLNDDGRPDIFIGNDFTQPDQIWLRDGSDWKAAEPFNTISESTMSFDQGDIDNDGRFELFTTDMKPYDVSTHTLASWLPMMATMPQQHAPGDRQVMENVLQVRNGTGFQNQAYARHVDASGWSWSGKFGDLDNDGWLDLYVVNGMIAAELFSHLPNDELVEANQVFHNAGGGSFSPAPEWNLGATESGRGMSMADLDGDGDLDIVVNNLQRPATVFENRLCGGNGLLVDLRMPGTGNTRALGAQLALHTSNGTLFRDVRAGSGYLSGDTAQVQFGIPNGATVDRLEIHWPDGRTSEIKQPVSGTRLLITRQ